MNPWTIISTTKDVMALIDKIHAVHQHDKDIIQQLLVNILYNRNVYTPDHHVPYHAVKKAKDGYAVTHLHYFFTILDTDRNNLTQALGKIERSEDVCLILETMIDINNDHYDRLINIKETTFETANDMSQALKHEIDGYRYVMSRLALRLIARYDLKRLVKHKPALQTIIRRFEKQQPQTATSCVAVWSCQKDRLSGTFELVDVSDVVAIPGTFVHTDGRFISWIAFE